MDELILTEAQLFMVECLRGKENGREMLHPWRKSWEFTVQHSQRVEALAVQIAEKQTPPLFADDLLTLRLAALLHDVARLEGVADHAERGAGIVAAWLNGRVIPDQEKLLSLIARHSEKEIPGPDLLHGILKDADTLDEIGAISILMCANWVDRSDPNFLANLLERLRQFEIPFCERKMAQLNTPAAKSILRQKQAFVADFISQLGYELSGNMEKMEQDIQDAQDKTGF
jgi:HD superfamily phosphodiesterase